MTREETCERCKWWEPWDEKAEDDIPAQEAWCKRYPPTIRPLPSEQLSADDTRHPVVLACDFCGEFTPKQQTTTVGNKNAYRVEAKTTACVKARNFIQRRGSKCVVYCKTPRGALRIVAHDSGCSQSEFIVIAEQ